MTQLLILRHAKSDWDSDAAIDFDRPLSKRGRRDAARVGCWLLRQHWVPDRVLSSPAKRARQTAERVCLELGIAEPELQFEERIYECSPGILLDLLSKQDSALSRVLLVGHNPDLESLVRLLAKADVVTPADGKLLPTATAALFETPDWGQLTPGCASLVSITRPTQMGECE